MRGRYGEISQYVRNFNLHLHRGASILRRTHSNQGMYLRVGSPQRINEGGGGLHFCHEFGSCNRERSIYGALANLEFPQLSRSLSLNDEAGDLSLDPKLL